MEKEKSIIQEGKAKLYVDNEVFYNPIQCFNRDMSVLVAITVAEDMQREYCMNVKNDKQKIERRKAFFEGKKSEKDEIGEPLKQDEKRLVNDVNEQTIPPKVELKVLDALAASGLRGFRYYLEVPFVKEAYANDFDESAVQAIKNNIKLNNINPDFFHYHEGDAKFIIIYIGKYNFIFFVFIFLVILCKNVNITKYFLI